MVSTDARGTTVPHVPTQPLVAPQVPAAAAASDDPVLNAVIDAVEHNADFHLAITVYVGGVLVSGEMVSDREYLAAVGQTFAAAGHGRSEAYATQLGRVLAEAGRRATTQSGPHRFINLKNVRVLSPGSAVIPSSGHWRGSAAAIDGYAWGLLT
ncbi:MAG TPA: hypothetical protein VF796_01420 [Humisphaera sp.]